MGVLDGPYKGGGQQLGSAQGREGGQPPSGRRVLCAGMRTALADIDCPPNHHQHKNNRGPYFTPTLPPRAGASPHLHHVVKQPVAINVDVCAGDRGQAGSRVG